MKYPLGIQSFEAIRKSHMPSHLKMMGVVSIRSVLTFPVRPVELTAGRFLQNTMKRNSKSAYYKTFLAFYFAFSRILCTFAHDIK